MARSNVKAPDHRIDPEARLAGGFGVNAAKQSPLLLLRRVVLANLLWENSHYESGDEAVAQIADLVPQCSPAEVSALAIEAREQQQLRHVPLLLAYECTRHPEHRTVVADLLPRIIQRADELTEFVALYWKLEGRRPLASGVKRGLARAFQRFNAYQLAKYDRGTTVKLRDVLFLVHAKPKDDDQAETWRQLVAGKLSVPDTWEVALSGGADKRETWERLIVERKLGALAFLRNLRNMEEAGVAPAVVRRGFANLRTERLLPLNFFAAQKAAPRWLPEIEDAMLGSLGHFPKLPGGTVLVVDVSGSMGARISNRGDFSRLDAAAAMAVMAREMCEQVTVWATAGSDYARKHATELLPAHRGFALAAAITDAHRRLGGGGIFTRQCLDHIRSNQGDAEETARTIVFSDSQDCDLPGSRVPRPFSQRNYIVDVSAHTRGVAYDGVWTAEVSGWSQRFLEYIQASETLASQAAQTG